MRLRSELEVGGEGAGDILEGVVVLEQQGMGEGAHFIEAPLHPAGLEDGGGDAGGDERAGGSGGGEGDGAAADEFAGAVEEGAGAGGDGAAIEVTA